MALEKEYIRVEQIEEMMLLADDVLRALQMNASDYTEQGEEIFDLLYEDYRFDEDLTIFHEVLRAEKEKNAEHEHLLYDLLHNKEYDLQSALDLSVDKLINQSLSFIIDKAVNIFRQGTSCGDTNYAADESVSSDYLKALFSMRVRDRMIVFASQRAEKKYYFLTWGTNCCHDMDEWVGIFRDISKLCKAYNEEIAKEESADHPETLQIFQFTEDCRLYKRVTPEELWGDIL